MEIIIPRQDFQIPFNSILNNIHGILTQSERKLLILFERYCFKDGRIYPKQKTLAYKLKMSVRQIQRLISSLVKKGFLAVVESSLLNRHLFGQGNSYHLLNNKAYVAKMSPEMSPEKQDHTINKNKYIKTKKSGFNVLTWLEQNKAKHGQAIIDALNTLTARWTTIKKPEAYAQKIVDVQSGNYFEAEHTARAVQEKKEIHAGYEKIAAKIGISLSGGREISETPAQITARMNRQRNKILDKFG